MPTVKDAARVTTSNRAVLRTCGGCGLISVVPPDTDTCPSCAWPNRKAAPPAPTGLEMVYQYAETIGRIQAWADMPFVSDAECLDKIRGFLAELDRFQAAHRKGAWGCR